MPKKSIHLKSILQKSRFLMICRYMQANMLAKINQRKGTYISRSGATHRGYKHDIKKSIGYINTVFDDYLLYGNIRPDDLRGHRILEIGPGDNLGVALKFISKGAAQVVCLDRFFSDRDESQQIQIYKALLASFGEEERRLAQSAISFSNGTLEFDEGKIEYISHIAVEAAQPLFQEESFDLIVSRAVLEHVFDLDKAFLNMALWLKVNGSLLHKIGLGPHKMFPGHSNPLTFLTVPGCLWPLMVSNTGEPNRKRVDYYREKLEELRIYDFKIYVTHIFGNEDEILPHRLSIKLSKDYDAPNIDLVRQVRKKLAKEFRPLSDEELLIAGIFLCAFKRSSL